MSLKNRDRLKGVHPDLVLLVEEVADFYPIIVLEGLRSKERQRELYKTGKSKTLFSKHLTGQAVDIAPLDLDWNDKESFCVMAGVVLAKAKDLGIAVRWGAAWEASSEATRPFDTRQTSFWDGAHFELV